MNSRSSRMILLTGVTRGLGRSLLEPFIESGLRIAACARSPEGIAELVSRYGERCRFDVVDVADARAVDEWATQVLATHGAPDIVLNNAAVMNRCAPLWEVDAQEFDQLMAINVSGTANVVRAFTPAMIAAGRGLIVNFSSGWGRSAAAQVGPYCTSKWAIEGFTRSLAQDLPAGLAAVALNPGIIDTEMLRKCWADGASAYEQAAEWARRAAPYLLVIGGEANGQPLTGP